MDNQKTPMARHVSLDSKKAVTSKAGVGFENVLVEPVQDQPYQQSELSRILEALANVISETEVYKNHISSKLGPVLTEHEIDAEKYAGDMMYQASTMVTKSIGDQIDRLNTINQQLFYLSERIECY